MIGSIRHIRGALVAPLQRSGWKPAALVAVLAVIGATSAAAGVIVPQKAERFATTFEARAVGDPSITSCPALGPGGQKFEGRYGGTMTIDGEEYAFNFTTLEALVDRSTGLGSAEGRWQLTDPRTKNVVGRGELIATATTDPSSEVEPPDPDFELQGMLIGTLEPPDPDLEPPDPDLEPPDPDLEPPDPDMPARMLFGNFSASLGGGATFARLKGAVGDPSVGDPTGLTENPAVIFPAVKC